MPPSWPWSGQNRHRGLPQPDGFGKRGPLPSQSDRDQKRAITSAWTGERGWSIGESTIGRRRRSRTSDSCKERIEHRPSDQRGRDRESARAIRIRHRNPQHRLFFETVASHTGPALFKEVTDHGESGWKKSSQIRDQRTGADRQAFSLASRGPEFFSEIVVNLGREAGGGLSTWRITSRGTAPTAPPGSICTGTKPGG